MKAVENLVREHSLLNLLWSTLEKQAERAQGGGLLNVDTAKDMLDAVNIFALGPHMAKEEQYLIPKMLEVGVPKDNLQVSLLHQEHHRIRDDVAALFEVFGELYAGNGHRKRRYIRMVSDIADFVRLHIYREEHQLFPTAETVFSKRHWRELEIAFGEADEAFGLDNIKTFEKTILRGAQEFGLGLYNGNVVPMLPKGAKSQGRFVIETYNKAQ